MKKAYKELIIPITKNEIIKKNLKLYAYLIGSGLISLLLSKLIDRPELTIVLTPIINIIGWQIEQQIKGMGITRLFK